jgi:hypothetical protein
MSGTGERWFARKVAGAFGIDVELAFLGAQLEQLSDAKRTCARGYPRWPHTRDVGVGQPATCAVRRAAA